MSWWRVAAFVCVPTLHGCGETKTLELFPKPTPMMPGPACGDEAKCPPDRAVCLDDQCVQCVDDADCMGGKATCLDHQCVECRLDEQCPADKRCFSEVGRCTESCASSAECKDKGRPTCQVERGFCVACLAKEDCKAEQVCDERDYTCVGCVDNVDCADAGSCDETRRECTK